MHDINNVRVILGGLLAGLVINFAELVQNGLVLADAWGAAFQNLGLTAPGNAQVAFFWITGFVLGIVLVWLYAAIRPRFGPGIQTAVWAGGTKERLTPETIARAARKGDRVAKDVFDEAARHLGTAVASLVNILNPDVIAVLGGVAGSFDLMKRTLRAVVARRAFSESAKTVTIMQGRLGHDAAPVGAALMARDSFGRSASHTPPR